MNTHEHVPVLKGPVLEGLSIRPDGCYVDGTFGRGGHSKAIIDLLGPAGRLIAIDRDPRRQTPGVLGDEPYEVATERSTSGDDLWRALGNRTLFPNVQANVWVP